MQESEDELGIEHVKLSLVEEGQRSVLQHADKEWVQKHIIVLMLTALHLDTDTFLSVSISTVCEELVSVLSLVVQTAHFPIDLLCVAFTFYDAHSLLRVFDVEAAQKYFFMVGCKPWVYRCDSFDASRSITCTD